jgi:hypothetical protein
LEQPAFTRVEKPAFTRMEGLNPQQQELMAKMIDDYIVGNKLCPMEYWTTPTKKTKKTDIITL